MQQRDGGPHRVQTLWATQHPLSPAQGHLPRVCALAEAEGCRRREGLCERAGSLCRGQASPGQTRTPPRSTWLGSLAGPVGVVLVGEEGEEGGAMERWAALGRGVSA